MKMGVFRDKIILPLVSGKRVLDCGGVDHGAYDSKLADRTWLHSVMSGHASEIVGIDILSDNVNRINAEGRFRFVCGNVEEMDFESEFDVVVGGEIIEHLYNPGRFLLSARKALRPGGNLVITTPNATRASAVAGLLFSRSERNHPEHTCLYSPQTLEYLVSHHGFCGIRIHKLNRPAGSAALGLARDIMIKINPLFCETIVLVAGRDEVLKSYEDKW